MIKRNVEIKVRLSRKEAETLNKRVKKSGISREAYIRHLIEGSVPREAPPPDYYAMMREIYAIGKNFNQIAQKAHVLNVMDAQRYDAEVRKLEAAIKTSYMPFILADRTKFRRVFSVTFAQLRQCCIITDALPDSKYSSETVIKEVKI